MQDEILILEDDQTKPKTQEEHTQDNIQTNSEIDMANVDFRESSAYDALEGIF
jgi:hypothetical protein